MPNWCECDLYVEGEGVADFLSHVDSGEELFDFNTLIPYPEEFRKQDEIARAHREKHGWTADGPRDGFNSGGYEWCCSNWGTKWNACDAYREHDSLHNTAFFGFQTAWAPPLPVIQKASELFPGLKFTLKYYEAGMCFQGEIVAQDGKIVKHLEGEYIGNRGG